MVKTICICDSCGVELENYNKAKDYKSVNGRMFDLCKICGEKFDMIENEYNKSQIECFEKALKKLKDELGLEV